jgi:hypothetical protein
MLRVILSEPYKVDLSSKFDINCVFEVTDLNVEFQVNIFKKE